MFVEAAKIVKIINKKYDAPAMLFGLGEPVVVSEREDVKSVEFVSSHRQPKVYLLTSTVSVGCRTGRWRIQVKEHLCRVLGFRHCKELCPAVRLVSLIHCTGRRKHSCRFVGERCGYLFLPTRRRWRIPGMLCACDIQVAHADHCVDIRSRSQVRIWSGTSTRRTKTVSKALYVVSHICQKTYLTILLGTRGSSERNGVPALVHSRGGLLGSTKRVPVD